MKPITAKGGEGLPTVRVVKKAGKYISMRPRFKLHEVDVKAMDNLCRNLGMSRSEWIGWQISRALGNE